MQEGLIVAHLRRAAGLLTAPALNMPTNSAVTSGPFLKDAPNKTQIKQMTNEINLLSGFDVLIK